MDLLVVEDDEDTLSLMVKLLSREGHQVRGALTIRAAKELLCLSRFDLLIMDIGLPDGTGYDLLYWTQRRALGVPAVALTGWATKGDVNQAKRAGFKAHLAKPIDYEKLLQTVASIIRS